MRWIDRLILKCPLQVIAIVLLCLVFTACGSHKSTVKTRSESHSEINVLGSDSLSGNRHQQTSSEESYNETTTTVRVEYDSSMPIVESTGKPPVKSEETVTQRKEATRKQEEDVQSDMNRTGSIAVSSDEQRNDVQDSSQTLKNDSYLKICALFVFVILIVVIIWLVKRKPH